MKEFFLFALPLLMAGMLIGVMLMAVADYYAPRLRSLWHLEEDCDAFLGKKPPRNVILFRSGKHRGAGR